MIEKKIKRKRKNRLFDRSRLVARDVIAKLEKGEKVTMREVIRANGYSQNTANNPKNVIERPAYQEEMNNYTQRLERERTRVIAAMEKKDLNTEQYRTLTEATTKFTHDIQLLTGGKTENVGVDKDRETLKAIVAAIQIEK
jgi:hypothetical protein